MMLGGIGMFLYGMKLMGSSLESAAGAKMEVRCLVVPGCTDGADLVARHRYLQSIGIPESSIVNLEYYDYARSKYLALGMPDTMPPKMANGASRK